MSFFTQFDAPYLTPDQIDAANADFESAMCNALDAVECPEDQLEAERVMRAIRGLVVDRMLIKWIVSA